MAPFKDFGQYTDLELIQALMVTRRRLTHTKMNRVDQDKALDIIIAIQREQLNRTDVTSFNDPRVTGDAA